VGSGGENISSLIYSIFTELWRQIAGYSKSGEKCVMHANKKPRVFTKNKIKSFIGTTYQEEDTRYGYTIYIKL